MLSRACCDLQHGALPECKADIAVHKQLTGTIPDEIGSMPLLYYLDLSDNQLEGRIPMTFQYAHRYHLLSHCHILNSLCLESLTCMIGRMV